MLNGGVLTALASLPAFENLSCTAAYNEDVAAGEDPNWHAVFCYGWADTARNTGEGWWLCKNSWGSAWGCNGTFRLAYGAAYGMPADYTYAIQAAPVSEFGKVDRARQLLREGTQSAVPSVNGTQCVLYKSKRRIRLVKLHGWLATSARASPNSNPAQIMLDLLAYNSGYLRNLAAPNSAFKMCGTTRDLLVAALDANVTSSDPQVAALLRIKGHIDTTEVLKDWSVAAGTTSAYCAWTGVSCDGNMQVTAIEIWSVHTTGLKGELPPAAAFEGLNSLTAFTLSQQPGITGTLPADWSQLRQLQDVRVSETSLYGSMPSSWGSLTKMRVFYLWANQLTGAIPKTFGALTSMQDLRLSKNRLVGSIPSSLGKLTNLQVLYLWGNQLTGRIPDSFGALTSLQDLQLSKNRLDGSIPSALGHLQMLKVMYLSYNQLTGSIPDSFGVILIQHPVDRQHPPKLWGINIYA
ncbi:hypothetical protein OEZ85_003084 [Tetradesmus obliquus]|uniref:Peptidase C1A papain C-terminal domain-containing protein n=1 Tax=Tetradesmus obliquus TaxID=3088 RepID=A0ABY8U297_TETOB|nr:hypothetical protein OEZ85_003084 [Tetradesmus obliquus]